MSIDNVNYLTCYDLSGDRTPRGYWVTLATLCAEGRRLGVPTPVNDAVVAEVRRHGVGTLTPDPKHLEPALAILPR